MEYTINYTICQPYSATVINRKTKCAENRDNLSRVKNKKYIFRATHTNSKKALQTICNAFLIAVRMAFMQLLQASYRRSSVQFR